MGAEKHTKVVTLQPCRLGQDFSGLEEPALTPHGLPSLFQPLPGMLTSARALPGPEARRTLLSTHVHQSAWIPIHQLEKDGSSVSWALKG